VYKFNKTVLKEIVFDATNSTHKLVQLQSKFNSNWTWYVFRLAKK